LSTTLTIRFQPAWNQDANIPLSKEEIEDVLIDLANKFGFQKGEHCLPCCAFERPR
jgi:hypothetical protein